jgi:tetratricopeptide (TPR) repeat protein
MMTIDKLIRSAFQFFQQGNFEEAERVCKDILHRQPDNGDILHLLGIIFYQQREYELAIEYISRSLEKAPDNASAYYNLAAVYGETGQFDKAIENYKKSIELDGSSAEAHNNLGIVLKQQGRRDEAGASFRRAIELDSDLVPAYYNLGTVLREKGQPDEAVSVYRKALELDSGNAAVHNALGLILREKGLLEQAVQENHKAVEHDPDNAAFRNNFGIALKEMGRRDEALFQFEKSFQLDPNDTALDRIYDIAESILQKGNMREGWALYWKYNDAYWHEHVPAKPIWNGGDIKGLSIVLQADGGFGDTIQYARYARLIADKGAKVILNCQKELVSLLRSVKGLDLVVPEISRREFDLLIPVRRLPFVFGTTLETIPAEVPYIQADTELVRKWEQRVQSERSTLKVGLVWAAGHGDRNRSCDLSLFAPLAKLNGMAFYSLQVENAGDAKNPPAGMRLIDFTDKLADFSDTAALIKNLDLVISVDTAVAHVAGALGVTVWTLLPYIVDSRWLLDREDSPWYPTMRLFRQPAPGEWEPVITRVAENLKALI